jgi:hypothetical protein
MQTNCVAIAKIVQNKKLETLRILITFDKSKKDKNGNVTVTVQNAIFNSGDICNITDNKDYKQYVIAKTLQQAQAQLRTNNIQFV